MLPRLVATVYHVEEELASPQREKHARYTHINHILDLSKCLGHRCANKWNIAEETSFAD
jgi:hypothetical protein